MDAETIHRGVPTAIRVLTTWSKRGDASLAEAELRSIIWDGPDAQAELIVGLIVLTRELLEDLAKVQSTRTQDVLRQIALRFA